MKPCGNCGRDITDRAPQARFCDDTECHTQRMLAHGRASYGRSRVDTRRRQNAAHKARVAARPPKVRLCRHCSSDISHRGLRATWCNMSCRERARHAANPTRARAKAARRRGVAGNGMTGAQWTQLVNRQHGRCYYCGEAVAKLTQEHVVPLNRGGLHSEGNIVASCKSCNCSKGDLLLVEWRPRRKLKHLRS